MTDETFAREVEQHKGVTMVDFSVAWCGPRHMIAPIVEEYDGRVKVAKLDV